VKWALRAVSRASLLVSATYAKRLRRCSLRESL